MKKMKIMSAVLAVMVLLSSVSAPVLAADDGTITVATADQLMRLAERCRLDSWSQGKTIVLVNDIDVSEYDFEPIPTFGGTFEGGGYTVSGVKLADSGSAVGGFFRYVQKGAVVRELNIEAEIVPITNAERFGGVAGENSGRIINCSFKGSISGSSDIGGIVGLNNPSGEIYGCKSHGTVSGEHYTGGIAGRNLGSIINCTNFSAVNTTNFEMETGELEINWENLNSTENAAVHTDTGGITGFSEGILEGCSNRGYIGYPHVGYNVGGVVGRHSGYIHGCENFGVINGRKDIGGVVGQMEPAIRMQYSVSEITALRGEMAVLETMIDAMLSDFELSSGEITDILSSAGEYLETAGDSAAVIIDMLSAFVDGNIETVNTVTATVARYVKKLEPVFAELEESFDYISSAMTYLSETVAALENAGEDMAYAVELLRYGIDEINTAMSYAQRAFAHIQNAMDTLYDALEGLNTDTDEGRDNTDGESTGEDAIPDLEDIFGGGIDPDEGGSDGEGDSTDGDTTPDLEDIFGGGTDPEMEAAVTQALAEISAAMEDLQLAGDHLSRGIEYGVIPALDELQTILNSNDEITEPLQSALDYLSLASDSMSAAMAELEKWVSDFSKEPAVKFDDLGEEFSEETSRMEAAIVGLGNDMERLNAAISSATSAITEDMRGVNDQFFLVMDHVLAILEGTSGNETVYEDMSEEELFTATQGKTEACTNRGSVEGDVNVGGIVGTIAIEYDLDPEEDVSVSGTGSSEFKYFTNAAVLDCRNYEAVTGKKDAVGGAVGYMDLGIVYGCENYGDVASTSGDYVGGIAGQSAAVIKNSWSLCNLSGMDYVGGIAGSGKDISSCRSIVQLTSSGWQGAIAGEASGKMSQNYFVSAAQGGIDGISYAGIAQPQDYNEFILAEGLPEEFLNFNLAFVAGNTIVERIKFNYGTSLDLESIPEVPEKDGYVGQWEEYDFNNLTFSGTVNAVYTPYDTVVAVSDEQGKRPIVLLEGAFVPDSVPKLSKSEESRSALQKFGNVLDYWTVSAEGNVADTCNVRYLTPADADEVLIYVLSDGVWKLTETATESSYLVFEAGGDSVSFAAVEIEKEFPLVPIIIATGSAVLLAAGIILLKVFRRRKAAKNKASE